MSDSLTIKFSDGGIEAALDSITIASQDQIRAAAQAGAQVFYDEVRHRAPIGADGLHYFYGQNKVYGPFSPGNLRRSIYQVYSKDKSSETRATYHISWNTRIGAAIAYAPYGGMVEYGTSKAAAKPFIRPAFDAKANEALKAAQAKFEEGMRSAGVVNG